MYLLLHIKRTNAHKKNVAYNNLVEEQFFKYLHNNN